MKGMIFDEQFSNKYAKNGAFGRNGFIRIITQILIRHEGSISKFQLHIPNINMVLDSFQEIDHLMILLSRKGVRELLLTNSNQRYKLPCYMFSCIELKKLKLENCFFKPPLEFEGFLNIEDLDLRNIDFVANLSGTQINLPQLKTLFLSLCTNIHNFNIKATKLRTLLVFHYPDATLLRLLHSPCLTHVAMYINNPIEESERVEKMTLAMMLSNLPNANHLLFNGLFVKVLITSNSPKRFPHVVSTLKRLSLLAFQLGDLGELEGALCLLRNLPNLEILTVTSLKTHGVIDYDVGPASDHLEAPNCLDCTLTRLQTVEITSLEGSRPQLLFIKLILAHSPSLKKFTIIPSVTCDAENILSIAKDVMQFPRASTMAKVFYLDPKP